MPLSTQDLARSIDHTFFASEATRADIEKLCFEARENSYHAVCVNGSRVELARTLLEESEVRVVALVSFPLGASDSDAKRYEVEIAVDQGAQEIDAVINIGRLKDGDHQYVLRELRDIAEAADERPVKAVLETHGLTREEKILACQLALDSGVQFISTATDFHSPAITIEELKFLRETLGPTFGLKAAGQIRDAQATLKLLEAGATRLGIMAGLDLLAVPQNG
jgi:deoxyribose-phosphate aldolase